MRRIYPRYKGLFWGVVLLFLFALASLFISPSKSFAQVPPGCFVVASGIGTPPCDFRRFNNQCNFPFFSGAFTGEECIPLRWPGFVCLRPEPRDSVGGFALVRCPAPIPISTPTPIPPTPTPTPTPTPPPQKFVIQGVVYIDRDNNGVVSTGDTLQQGSSLSLQDVTTGSGGIPKSFPTTDSGGFYQTSRIWDDRHFISINLGTVPSGCTAASSPRTIQIFGSDATSNFPIVCQPTPTPIPCSSFATCASCIQQPACGWGGVAVYECREGTSNVCPTVNGQKYTLWNWSSCGASPPQNTCPVPTPTPIPTAVPTPTGGPTPTPTGGPTPTRAPTPTPFPTGIPCPNGTVGGISYACLSACPAGTTREPLACSPNPNGSLRVCCSVPAATPTPTSGPTPIPPTPTPTGCGNYDTPLSGYLTCQGGYMCNHCGQCIIASSTNNSCTAAGYVCVNRWIPQGGFPRSCYELDVSGKVSLPDGSGYRGGLRCSGTDAYGSPICTFGDAVITIQRATKVCTSPPDAYGSPTCYSFTTTPGSVVGSANNTQSGDYRYSPLTVGEYIVSIAPPPGFIGISVGISSFKRSCFDPSGSARQCTTPTVSMSNPSFDKVLSPTSALISIPPGDPPIETSWTTVDFVIGIAPSYSISGAIFTDTNGDEKKNPTESNYTGAINIGLTNGFANFAVGNNNGNYSSNNLPQGQYTVTFSGLPQGLVFTYPLTPLIVNVGPGCSVPITSQASCSSGNIINLNAGVTDSADAWFQSTGSDMRWDSGFSNALPRNKYASILGSGGMPGIIFSGTITPSFGLGSASQFNWKVSGSASDTRDVFTDTHNLIPTSYRFLLETAQGSGITLINITTLDSSLTHGIYKVNGDLNLSGSSYTFGPGNFIILVDGNLNINKKILVPIGSTAIFSASGNITVNRAIGEIASSSTSTIEGLYSADGNFVADGNKDCSITSDLRLNVAGSVIANAGRGSGTFVNNRDMCAGNSSFPSVSFIERPDFMLNYPNLAQSTTRVWQEVAP